MVALDSNKFKADVKDRIPADPIKLKKFEHIMKN